MATIGRIDMTDVVMGEHEVVGRAKWVEARLAHLAAEKELTRRRDELSRQRRELPWLEVTEEYVFDGPHGEQTLADLFAGRSQLLVYHFMYGPGWGEGCPSCSFWADNYDGIGIHLAHRDTTLVAIARAPYEELAAYRERMGWSFDLLSSNRSSFNHDMGVSFTPEQLEAGEKSYNFGTQVFGGEEAPGISVFARTDDGRIFLTYQTFARGLDMLNGAYHMLDLTPKGRDEDDLPWSMAWLHRHDAYPD
jgi:predicted dithiol-disulfide oxidoreductase (DUF899 family)